MSIILYFAHYSPFLLSKFTYFLVIYDYLILIINAAKHLNVKRNKLNHPKLVKLIWFWNKMI